MFAVVMCEWFEVLNELRSAGSVVSKRSRGGEERRSTTATAAAEQANEENIGYESVGRRAVVTGVRQAVCCFDDRPGDEVRAGWRVARQA